MNIKNLITDWKTYMAGLVLLFTIVIIMKLCGKI